MHWVYVIICEDRTGNGTYYVGETRRLITRLNEHNREKKIIRLFALYRLDNEVSWKSNSQFSIVDECPGDAQNNKQEACALERELNHQISISRKKYIMSNAHYNKTDIYRPFCNCPFKIPAEVVKSKRGKFYFTCAKNNMKWLDQNNYIDFNYDSDTCDFFQWNVKPEIINENTQKYTEPPKKLNTFLIV